MALAMAWWLYIALRAGMAGLDMCLAVIVAVAEHPGGEADVADGQSPSASWPRRRVTLAAHPGTCTGPSAKTACSTASSTPRR